MQHLTRCRVRTRRQFPRGRTQEVGAGLAPPAPRPGRSRCAGRIRERCARRSRWARHVRKRFRRQAARQHQADPNADPLFQLQDSRVLVGGAPQGPGLGAPIYDRSRQRVPAPVVNARPTAMGLGHASARSPPVSPVPTNLTRHLMVSVGRLRVKTREPSCEPSCEPSGEPSVSIQTRSHAPAAIVHRHAVHAARASERIGGETQGRARLTRHQRRSVYNSTKCRASAFTCVPSSPMRGKSSTRTQPSIDVSASFVRAPAAPHPTAHTAFPPAPTTSCTPTSPASRRERRTRPRQG